MTFRTTPLMRNAILACTLLAAVPATAQVSPLSPDHQFKLRCAAAFARVAEGQAGGDPVAKAYPALAERGREYFVRAGAEAIDAGLTREQLAQHLQAASRDLADPVALDAAMPPCLASLEASGL